MELSPDIILETDRCKIRQIKKEDIGFIFSATRYKGFNDGLLWDAPKSELDNTLSISSASTFPNCSMRSLKLFCCQLIFVFVLLEKELDIVNN